MPVSCLLKKDKTRIAINEAAAGDDRETALYAYLKWDQNICYSGKRGVSEHRHIVRTADLSIAISNSVSPSHKETT